MSTDVGAILAGAGVELSERDEQARKAVKNFRALQPTLTSYAKMLTKRTDVRVEMAARDNGSTDGKRIFYRPPLALGDTTPHVRKLCDKRDDALQQKCPACKRREETLVVIYHEIAHICFDSFALTSDADKAKLIEEAVKQYAGKYASHVSARIQAAPSYTKNSYIGMAGLVNEFLPLIVNALEDARVNRDLFRARKGTKKMFDALAFKTFTEGVEQKDPDGNIVVIPWNQYPQNMQAIIGLFCAASGYTFDSWFVKPVVDALHDEKLTDLLRRMDTIRSASGVYHLSFPVLSRLRDLGFCKLDTDPTDEEEEQGDDKTEDQDSSSETSKSDDASDSGESEAGEDTEGSSEADSASNESSDEGGDDGSTNSSSGVDDSERDEGSEPDSDGLDMGEDSDDANSDGERVGDSDDTTGSDQDHSGGEEMESNRDEGDSSPDRVDDEMGSTEGSDQASEEEFDPSSDSTESGDCEDSRGDSVDDDSGTDDISDQGFDSDSSSSSEGTGDIQGDELDDSPDDGQDDLAEPNRSAGDPGDGRGSARNRQGDPDQDHSEGSEGDSVGDTVDLESSTDDEVGESGDRESEMDSPESSQDSSGVESKESDQSTDEIIDSGADQGLGGTQLIEAEEDLPEMGSANEVEEALKQWGHHEDDPPKTAQEVRKEEDDREAIDRAIIQGMYFETPSREVYGVHEYNFNDPEPGGAWEHSVYTATGYSLKSLGIDGEFDPPESIMGPALLQMRRTFSDNARGSDLRNLRGGRVNTKVLGRRAPFGDDRLFTKRRMPGKKKYFVVIGADISGSTVGMNIALEKRAVTAQAELCSRLGIDFAIYGHTGSSEGWMSDFYLDIYRVKERHEPWDTSTRERLHQLGPDNVNLDGHTLEYYRKRLDESDATDKIIMYYTDGKMPAANYEEELEILQRELQICRAKKYTVMGVGIRTDSPVRHGLDTVQVDGDEDISRVVKHLEKRLLAP